MTRKRVHLVHIADDSARKASFKKRKQGLLKKVKELTILCDVSAFVIIYGPNDNEPTIWPSRPIVEELLARFESIPEIERCKKMMNQESYLKERGLKMNEQLREHHKKNGDIEMGNMMHQINQGKQFIEFQTRELTNLFWMIDDKMKEIRRRTEYIQHVPLPLIALPTPHSFQGEGFQQPIGGSMIKGEKASAETLWDDIYADIMKNKGSNTARATSSVRSEIGLPYSSTANNLGLSFANFSYDFNEVGRTVPTYDTSLPNQDYFGGTNMGSEMSLALGLPTNNYGTIENSFNSANAIEFGLQSNFHEYVGHDIGFNYNNNPEGQEFPHRLSNKGGINVIGSNLGFPSNLFSGNNTGSDAGLSYDVTKTWITPPSP